ncbi:MAG: hypothetical protein P4M12_03095 [Gammaproteobacteria bacterium]|nr:hypothetical protein [Gammaproteobacteria bacterium]
MSNSRLKVQLANKAFDSWLSFFAGYGECNQQQVEGFISWVIYADALKQDESNKQHFKKANEFLAVGRKFFLTNNLGGKEFRLKDLHAYYLLYTGEMENDDEIDRASVRRIFEMGYSAEFKNRLEYGFPGFVEASYNISDHFDGSDRRLLVGAEHDDLKALFQQVENEYPQNAPPIIEDQSVEPAQVNEYVTFYREKYPSLSRRDKIQHNKTIAEVEKVSPEVRDDLFRIAIENKPKSKPTSLWGKVKEKCKQLNELSWWKKALILTGVAVGGLLIAVGTGGIALPAVIAGWTTLGVGLGVKAGVIAGAGLAAVSVGVGLAVSGDAKVYDPVSSSETKESVKAPEAVSTQEHTGSQDTYGINYRLGLSPEAQYTQPHEHEHEHGMLSPFHEEESNEEQKSNEEQNSEEEQLLPSSQNKSPALPEAIKITRSPR